MALWHTLFLCLKCANQLLLSATGGHTRPQQVQIFLKVSPTALLSESGLSPQTGWAKLPFEHIMAFISRAEKPNKDINSPLFFMDKKGLRKKLLLHTIKMCFYNSFLYYLGKILSLPK
jgi:hypothetical protein